MRLRLRPLPPAGSCSVAAAIGVVLAVAGSVVTALPAAASVAAAARAGRSTAAPAAPAPAGTLTGVLTGVVRAPGGSGLARVCVVASGTAGTRAAVTGPGGRYVITGLRPGSYAVGFRDCGASGRFMDQWYGGSMLPGGAAWVQVTASTPTRLRPVILEPVGGMRATYRAGVRHAAGPAAISGPSISGVVRNAAGKGLAGVCVSVAFSTANSAGGAGMLTRRGGHYSFSGLARGRWAVSFANDCGGRYAPQWWKHVGSQAKATLLQVRRGSHFTGIDAKLVVGGVITGTVRAGRSSGPGLGGVCVVANGRGRAAGVQQQAKTRRDGSYRITGLGTGRYRIQFDSHCGAGGRYIGRTRKGLVSVTNGNTTRGINTFLVRAAQISGTVTAAQGGAPLAGICVLPLPVLTGHGFVASGGFGIQSGPQGGYTITGLRPGRYTVNFSGGCGWRQASTPPGSTRPCSRAARSPAPLPIMLARHSAGCASSPPPPRTPVALARASTGWWLAKSGRSSPR